MEQKRTLSKWISARRYIREFAADYAERYAEDPAEIERDIIAAKKQNHISLNEYEWVGYHDRTEAQKRTMSTLWTRAEFRKNFTDRRYIAILMNKYIFSKVFADFYGRRCVQASDVDAALLESLAGDCGKVVYKPNCKGQGTGVRVLPAVTEQEQEQTLCYLRANPGGIVEEYIQQHPTLAQLNPGAVSIVRFYTVTAPSGTYLFAPVLTAAIEKDISNGCQDALTAMIDIRTGVVLTDAVDQNNCIDYAAHPVTGVAFPGLQLPFWDETIDMMRRAVPLASKISNIGWDVTMTADGPLIIEANTNPASTPRSTAATLGSRTATVISRCSTSSTASRLCRTTTTRAYCSSLTESAPRRYRHGTRSLDLLRRLDRHHRICLPSRDRL